jgi:hypothetical protein
MMLPTGDAESTLDRKPCKYAFPSVPGIPLSVLIFRFPRGNKRAPKIPNASPKARRWNPLMRAGLASFVTIANRQFIPIWPRMELKIAAVS